MVTGDRPQPREFLENRTEAPVAFKFFVEIISKQAISTSEKNYLFFSDNMLDEEGQGED